MGGGGGAGNTFPGNTPSQTQVFRPWKVQTPYLKDIYARASDQSMQPQSYYPGSTVAPQDEATIAANKMIEDRARAGSPLLKNAQGYTNDVLSGRYLNANPYLDQMFDQAAAGIRRNFDMSVLPDLETRFAGVGGLGSSAYQSGLSEAARGLASGLGEAATNIYGGNYQAERDRQAAAVGDAAPLANADYYDPTQLLGVGEGREKFAQSTLDDLVNRFNFEQQEPATRLARFASMIGSPMGGQATSFGNTKRGGDWGTVLVNLIGGAL